MIDFSKIPRFPFRKGGRRENFGKCLPAKIKSLGWRVAEPVCHSSGGYGIAGRSCRTCI